MSLNEVKNPAGTLSSPKSGKNDKRPNEDTTEEPSKRQKAEHKKSDLKAEFDEVKLEVPESYDSDSETEILPAARDRCEFCPQNPRWKGNPAPLRGVYVRSLCYQCVEGVKTKDICPSCHCIFTREELGDELRCEACFAQDDPNCEACQMTLHNVYSNMDTKTFCERCKTALAKRICTQCRRTCSKRQWATNGGLCDKCVETAMEKKKGACSECARGKPSNPPVGADATKLCVDCAFCWVAFKCHECSIIQANRSDLDRDMVCGKCPRKSFCEVCTKQVAWHGYCDGEHNRCKGPCGEVKQRCRCRVATAKEAATFMALQNEAWRRGGAFSPREGKTCVWGPDWEKLAKLSQEVATMTASVRDEQRAARGV